MRYCIFLLAFCAAGQTPKVIQVISGGSGSGSVTSVGLAGTTNQVCISGSTPIITSGGWSVSICNPFVFPGPAGFASSSTSSASLNIPSGTPPTTPNAGDMWNASGSLFFYDGSVSHNLTAGGSGGVPTATVATLPASPSGNPTYLVTDAQYVNDCATGGASGFALCSYSSRHGWIPSSWFSLSNNQPVSFYGIDSSGYVTDVLPSSDTNPVDTVLGSEVSGTLGFFSVNGTGNQVVSQQSPVIDNLSVTANNAPEVALTVTGDSAGSDVLDLTATSQYAVNVNSGLFTVDASGNAISGPLASSNSSIVLASTTGQLGISPATLDSLGNLSALTLISTSNGTIGGTLDVTGAATFNSGCTTTGCITYFPFYDSGAAHNNTIGPPSGGYTANHTTVLPNLDGTIAVAGDSPFVVSAGGKIGVTGGITASGSACTITAITNGIITGATCTP